MAAKAGFTDLAAAVSNAGGLGIIAGLTHKAATLLAEEIAKCRAPTDKPLGVVSDRHVRATA